MFNLKKGEYIFPKNYKSIFIVHIVGMDINKRFKKRIFASNTSLNTFSPPILIIY